MSVADGSEASQLIAINTARGRATIATYSAAHLSQHMVVSLLNPMLPLIRDTFRLGYTEAGILVSAFSLSAGLSNVPMGVLADRFGPRIVLVAGLVLTGVASVTVSLACAYWELLVLLVAVGVISGAYHAPATALISRTFSERGRGVAMGVHVMGGSLSFFIAPILAGLVVAVTGTWRTPYQLVAVVPIAAGVMLWLVAPRVHVRPQGGSIAALRDIALVGRRIGTILSLSIVSQIGYAGFVAFLSLYLVDERAVPVPLAAVLVGAPLLATTLGAPIAGWLSDRLGRRAVIASGLAATGPCIWSLSAAPTELVLLPLLLTGATIALRAPATELLVAESAPAESRGTVLGAYHLLTAEVGGMATPLFGALAATIGLAQLFTLAGMSLTVLSAVVIGLALARRL